jgi:hypothetical protein
MIYAYSCCRTKPSYNEMWMFLAPCGKLRSYLIVGSTLTHDHRENWIPLPVQNAVTIPNDLPWLFSSPYACLSAMPWSNMREWRWSSMRSSEWPNAPAALNLFEQEAGQIHQTVSTHRRREIFSSCPGNRIRIPSPQVQPMTRHNTKSCVA